MNSVNQSQFFNPLMEDHSSPRSSNSSFDESKFGLGFTSNLLSTLEKSRSRIDEFCRKSKEIIDVACQTNSALSLQEQHEIDELVSKLQTLKRQRGVPTTTTSTKSPSHDIVLRDATNTQVVSIPNQRVVLKERQKVLEKELAHVYTSNKQKLRILQDAEKEEQEYRVKAEEARRAKLRVEEAKKTTVEDLSLGVLKYKKLGLNFEKVADSKLRFIFNNLDASNPKRKFSFILGANDDEMYEILDCYPPMEESKIATFLDHLNETSDVSTFVRTMRKEFKRIILCGL